MTARDGVTAQTRERVETFAEILEYDRNVNSAARRAGFPSVAAAQIACRRCGRNDLAAAINFYAGKPSRTRGAVNPYGDGAADFYIRRDGDPWAGKSAGRYSTGIGRRSGGPRADRFERQDDKVW